MSIAEKLTQIAENEQKVFEAGKQAECALLFNAIQQGGAKTDYSDAYAGSGWTTELFKPIYNMKPKNATFMFRWTGITGDLVEILESLGVTLDFSECTIANELFANAKGITRVGVLDFSRLTGTARHILSNSGIKIVDKVIFSEGTNVSGFPGTADKLTVLTVGGVIWSDMNYQYCFRLTHDSYMSILNALKNYAGSDATHTLTLCKTGYERPTDEELAPAIDKGWTIVFE